jgi:hypothetical protein
MNKVSRPMQILLAGVLVFAALWFVALKPKDDAAEPVSAAPVTPAATTPRPVEAGGAAAQSGAGKAVEAANNAAAGANAAAAAAGKQTGDAPAATTVAAKSAAAKTAASATPVSTSPDAAAKRAALAEQAAIAKKAAAQKRAAAKTQAAKKASAAKKGSTRSAAQRRADRVTEAIGKHLAAGRAVVVLVSTPTGTEDKILRKRVRKEINRRHGRVRVFLVPASAVGLYEGLVGSLNLGQTPSTIIIAPNNEAKVLGGLVSTQRIDRLTSAALLVETAKAK